MQFLFFEFWSFLCHFFDKKSPQFSMNTRKIKNQNFFITFPVLFSTLLTFLNHFLKPPLWEGGGLHVLKREMATLVPVKISALNSLCPSAKTLHDFMIFFNCSYLELVRCLLELENWLKTIFYWKMEVAEVKVNWEKGKMFSIFLSS